MYFPTASARRITGTAAPGTSSPTPIAHVVLNHRKSLFCCLSMDGISIWRVRPTALLAHIARTSNSVATHGYNLWASWSSDGSKIVIQTTLSHLLIVSLTQSSSYTPYESPPLPSSAQRHFLSGPGEAHALPGISLRFDGVIRVNGGVLSISCRRTHILFSTESPATVQQIPWPSEAAKPARKRSESAHESTHHTWRLNTLDLPWLLNNEVAVTRIVYARGIDVEVWITSDGRAYFVQKFESEHSADHPGSKHGESSEQATVSRTAPSAETTSDTESITTGSSRRHPQAYSSPSINKAHAGDRHNEVWDGACIYGNEGSPEQPPETDPSSDDTPQQEAHEPPEAPLLEGAQKAIVAAINTKFSLVAIGTPSGSVHIAPFPLLDGTSLRSHSETFHTPSQSSRTGPVRSMEWTSDGYALAVGWEKGWALWSVGGRCLVWAGDGEENAPFSLGSSTPHQTHFQDIFMKGVASLCWLPGNLDLLVLADTVSGDPNEQLFIIPFAKSAVTNQQSPDNTRYAFLQMDDRVLIYRGADQPDMSVINPEADVWQHITVPLSYMAINWPIRYASISNDGRLIAVAGRRGLIHYSTSSGRWKIFADEGQEQAFTVKGGLLWFHHVLIAGVEVGRSYQVRLYSRDLELSNLNVLHREFFPAMVVLLSLVDNSLLVYTADNTLYHYLVVPTNDTIKLYLCGSISFEGVVALPTAVRGMSWMIPQAQKELGDPTNDLVVATILLLVGGRLVLLRPRKAGAHEVKYDLQILADRVEFCWIHLRGIGTLENSLWGYDGKSIRVWLDALTIETPASPEQQPSSIYESVKESVNIPLDFYPLSVLMDKGIIIGVEQETVSRPSLPFVMFKIHTSTHLFIHHVLRHHLNRNQLKEAVLFASHYQHLVYFAHALEVLLHTIVEAEADIESPERDVGTEAPAVHSGLLPVVVEFLDYFDASLDVVVGCARKTEVARWKRLFDIVGNPQTLFETCLASNMLKTAASYLLVLHSLEDTEQWEPSSLTSVEQTVGQNTSANAVRLLRQASSSQDWILCQEILRFLRSIDESGAAVKNALAEANVLPDLGRTL